MEIGRSPAGRGRERGYGETFGMQGWKGREREGEVGRRQGSGKRQYRGMVRPVGCGVLPQSAAVRGAVRPGQQRW